MTDSVDVVVVGGGIAGAALATVLARDGLSVTMLERQAHYQDRVRGEVLSCWGVTELRELGLEQVLLDAGGGYIPRAVSYDETTDPEQAENDAAMLDQMVPGVPGTLTVGHPDACQALADAAAAAGAHVVRGAADLEVQAGHDPTVTYEHNGELRTLRARIVVGADGRTSSVRKQLGFLLHQTVPRTMIGGLLVDGLDSWPADQLGEGTENDLHYYVLPRSDGRARLYLLHDIEQKRRFAGADRTTHFLEAFRFDCMPQLCDFSTATPAGNCISYPLNDSWIDTPYRQGAVLIGDAAGWNDPIIGQGLSLALRDARKVAKALLTHDHWSPDIFDHYGRERYERMRRLRVTAQIKTSLVATFTEAGTSRRRTYNSIWHSDPTLAAPQLAPLVGPHNSDSAMFTGAAVNRILSLV
ncbi:FAD-dependent oxidoreductase [Nocardia salmonicida]|uniref:FAD-dependent oxidoreductase n=1 Tax=Nocardia salmonicida TaxID=53431 RepID=UPI003627B209